MNYQAIETESGGWCVIDLRRFVCVADCASKADAEATAKRLNGGQS